MGRFHNWVSRLKSKNEPEPDGPIEPPRLPPARLRSLTPTSDNEISAHPQTQSPFFSKLPLEIRLQIYEYTLGNRTVHAQLAYDHPIIKSGYGHAGLGRPPNECTKHDLKQGSRWRWNSCACCRSDDCTFYEDRCLKGGVVSCEKGDPLECRIHSAWLLVCRKAYTESVPTLYSSNTFHFKMWTMLPGTSRDWTRFIELNSFLLFSQLVLPPRLNSITSLEIVYDFIEPPLPGDEPYRQTSVARYEKMWRQVLLPGLRKLRISFLTFRMSQCGASPSAELDAVWLNAPDDAVRAMRLDLELTVPSTWFWAFNKNGATVIKVNELGQGKYWRTVEGGEQTAGAVPMGYWLNSQWDYVEYLCTMGEGFPS